MMKRVSYVTFRTYLAKETIFKEQPKKHNGFITKNLLI